MSDKINTKLGLLENLLGNAREGRELCGAFSNMIQVLPEEFSIKGFKQLNHELKLSVHRPSQVYDDYSRWNPRHAKKLTELEDLVQAMPPPIVEQTLAME